jgi:hypothetical protein
VTDEFIFSGEGSGCQYDDDDDCSQTKTDNDVLIKPTVHVKHRPTPPPPIVTRSVVQIRHLALGTKSFLTLNLVHTLEAWVVVPPRPCNLCEQSTEEGLPSLN